MADGKRYDQIACPIKEDFGVLKELSATPGDPEDGQARIWLSDGTGAGADGDVVVTKTVAGSTTNVVMGAAGDVTALETEIQILDGDNLADVADDQTIGGVPILFAIAIAGGATADEDVTITQKIRVIDFWAQMNGAGDTSDTLQLKSTTAAISDALDWTGSDKAIVRAASLDDANATVASGGILRVTMTDNAGSNGAAGVAYVLAIPSA